MEKVNALLAQIKESNDHVMGIRVIDSHGQIIGTSDTGLGGTISHKVLSHSYNIVLNLKGST